MYYNEVFLYVLCLTLFIVKSSTSFPISSKPSSGIVSKSSGESGVL